MERLPRDIVEVIVKTGKTEVRNLKYTSKYFYNIFSDRNIQTHIKDEINLPPIGIWGTKLYFIKSIEKRRFNMIVDFFNCRIQDQEFNTMIELCIKFFDKTEIKELIERIKNKEVKRRLVISLDNCTKFYRCATENLSNTKRYLNKNSKDVKYNIIQLEYDTSVKIDNLDHEIIQLKEELNYELEKNRKGSVYSDKDVRIYEAKQIYKLTNEQIEVLESSDELDRSWFIILYLANKSSCRDLIEKIGKHRFVQTLLLTMSDALSYFFNFCSLENLEYIFKNTDFLNSGFVISRISTITRKEVLKLLSQYIENDLIVHMDRIISDNFTQILKFYEEEEAYNQFSELISLVPLNVTRNLIEYSLSNNESPHMVIQYINLKSFKGLDRGNEYYVLIKCVLSILKHRDYNTIRFICKKIEIDPIDLFSYCYKKKSIKRSKGLEVIEILNCTKEMTKIEGYKERCNKVIEFIEENL